MAAKKKLIAIDRHLSNIECIHSYNIDIENRVVYLSSEFSSDDYTESGTEHQMYNRFVKNMDLLNSTGNEPITIRSSNIGGDWYYGMAIYDIIKRSNAETYFYIDAYACSMGSIIPQGATKRYISKYADFLIHLGTFSLSQELKSFKSTFKQYESKTPVMYDVYAERCVNGQFFVEKGLDKDATARYLEKMVDKHSEWWLTAEDAIYYGFADEIY